MQLMTILFLNLLTMEGKDALYALGNKAKRRAKESSSIPLT